MKELSERLKMLILYSGYSYRDLEKKTGIAYSTIGKYANGAIGKMPLDRLEALAKALNCDPAYLIGWSNEKPSAPAVKPDKRAAEFLSLFSQLSEEQKGQIISLIKMLASK